MNTIFSILFAFSMIVSLAFLSNATSSNGPLSVQGHK
jgi:hypothetical protein